MSGADPKVLEQRIAAANAALLTFSPGASLQVRGHSVFVVFAQYRADGKRAYRWQTRRGQSFFPVWHRRWPGGGTSVKALSQLVRWIKDQPVLGIPTWRYWSGESIGLLPRAAVDALAAAGYPPVSVCVLCGLELRGGHDWWNLDGVSGPACGWTHGCRQKVTAPGPRTAASSAARAQSFAP